MNEEREECDHVRFCAYLNNINECFAFVVDPGSMKHSHLGIQRNPLKGCPDIICCYKGCFLGIEIKKCRNNVSDSQKDFITRIRKSGGWAIVASNTRQIRSILRTIDERNRH